MTEDDFFKCKSCDDFYLICNRDFQGRCPQCRSNYADEQHIDDIWSSHVCSLFKYAKSEEFLQSIPMLFKTAFPVGSKQILQKCPSILPKTVTVLGYTFGRTEFVNNGFGRELHILDYKVIVQFEDREIWFVDPKIYFPRIPYASDKN